MKIFNQRKTVLTFIASFLLISFVSSVAAISMHPYNEDPEKRALGNDANKKKQLVVEEKLTGDALRDKILADPQSEKNGELRFAQTCAAYCHGDKGSAGEVPLQCQVEHTPEYLFAIIAEGRRTGSKVMPSWKVSISEKERWELVAFILSLKNLPHCSE